MKKRLIIGSSIILIIASVIMHFFLKDPSTVADTGLQDFITGAMFGAGITFPLLLLNARPND